MSDHDNALSESSAHARVNDSSGGAERGENTNANKTTNPQSQADQTAQAIKTLTHAGLAVQEIRTDMKSLKRKQGNDDNAVSSKIIIHISGKHSKTREFRNKPGISSSSHGETQRKNNIQHTLQSGLIFASKRLTPFNPISTMCQIFNLYYTQKGCSIGLWAQLNQHFNRIINNTK